MPSKRPNIIIIVIDTLRLDRAGFLSESLEGAIDYGHAISPAPWTLPAHVSLLTGLYPSVHESHEKSEIKSLTDFANLRNTKRTLMSRLKNYGYKSYGFSANSFISDAFGFESFDILRNWQVPWSGLVFNLDKNGRKKFEKYEQSKRGKDFAKLLGYLALNNPSLLFSFLHASIGLATDVVFRRWPQNKGFDRIAKFVESTKFTEPFFLFLNILEVHEPYHKHDQLTSDGVRKTSTFNPDELEMWVKGYDFQTKKLAKKMPHLFEILKRKGLFEDSLILVTSDHGQLLGEHGFIGHSVYLFDELVKVPLLIKYPSSTKIERSAEKAKKMISLTNIPNFVVDIVEGRESDASLYTSDAFSESWSYQQEGSPARRICVYSEKGKVTYDLEKGQVEEADVVPYNKNSVQELTEKCIRFANLSDKLRAIIVQPDD